MKHWLQWAVKEFSLEGVDVDGFGMNGRQLVDLKHEDFVRFIPFDKGDVLWTHLELLRKCKFVGRSDSNGDGRLCVYNFVSLSKIILYVTVVL